MFHEIVQCRGCASRQIEEIFTLKPTPIGDNFSRIRRDNVLYPLGLSKCAICNLVQLRQKVVHDVVFENYFSSVPIENTSNQSLRGYVSKILQVRNLRKGSLVVAVGSGDGYLLDEIVCAGNKVLGIEPSEKYSSLARSRGIDTITDYLTDRVAMKISHDYGLADAIIIDNSSGVPHPTHIANIGNPARYVENLRRMISPKGIVAVRAPYLGDLISHLMFDYIYHEHQSYFSIETIRALFSQSGFNLIGLQSGKKGVGNMQYFFSLDTMGCQQNLEIMEFIAQEHALDLASAATYKDLAGAMENSRSNIRKELDSFQGMKIVGYGASAPTMTLIYQYGLADYFDFLVDDNKEKIGLFSPGTNLPVKSPEALYEEQVDVVVILAWPFAEQIMKRHSEFKGQITIPRINR